MKTIKVDSALSWTAALCACLLDAIVNGIMHNYSLLTVALLAEFGETQSITTLPGSLGLAIVDFTGQYQTRAIFCSMFE